ncbi:lysM and putative peptidoglycan-binding domain-containing protein 4 [Protopterus annectens]|uniref:lysM and putative peptidoglycan-binding domain-containing protein 4 n=1 Tax=Protopterus annectens TaxID=7888 RepID=UPI001CF94950|nr:lysM and putative peptidoglycan-binding domain-containing protein 4 [Protopterus annectens]
MRLKDGLVNSFQAPVDVHHAQDGSSTYTFQNAELDSEDSSVEEFEAMELRPRGRAEQQDKSLVKDRVGDIILLERQITEEDNLNRLALQYGCMVADIKRVNNLIKEQDIYALKVIKIPVKKHGLLTEANKELKKPQHASRKTSTMLGVSECEGSSTSSRRETHYTDYFKGIEQTIENLIVTLDQPCDNRLNEVIGSSAADGSSPSPASNKDIHHGADWGIQWWNAVVVMLLIGIILPVFYIAYFKTQEPGVPPDILNKTVSKNNTSMHKNHTVVNRAYVAAASVTSQSRKVNRYKSHHSQLG